MTLLVGTDDGIYRIADGTLDDVELVLDSGVTLRVLTFEDRAYAATKTGLFRSTDGGATWEDLDVPRTEVYSVVLSPDGTRLYAGTHPAHVFVSTDDGGSWTELDALQDLPSRDRWHTPRHRNAAHVRSLVLHPDVPGRVIAGVEVGGVHVSDDEGETWTERRDDLQNERADDLQYDVHHVLVRGADEYVVSCGGGLYRTRDAGRSWMRLDGDLDRSYFQEAVAHRGRLYAGAQTLPPTLPMGGRKPPRRQVDAALYESVDGGDTFESVAYPGGPDEVVDAFAIVHGGVFPGPTGSRVLAGTTGGRILLREDESWRQLGRIPGWVTSLAVA